MQFSANTHRLPADQAAALARPSHPKLRYVPDLRLSADAESFLGGRAAVADKEMVHRTGVKFYLHVDFGYRSQPSVGDSRVPGANSSFKVTDGRRNHWSAPPSAGKTVDHVKLNRFVPCLSPRPPQPPLPKDILSANQRAPGGVFQRILKAVDDFRTEIHSVIADIITVDMTDSRRIMASPSGATTGEVDSAYAAVALRQSRDAFRQAEEIRYADGNQNARLWDS